MRTNLIIMFMLCGCYTAQYREIPSDHHDKVNEVILAWNETMESYGEPHNYIVDNSRCWNYVHNVNVTYVDTQEDFYSMTYGNYCAARNIPGTCPNQNAERAYGVFFGNGNGKIVIANDLSEDRGPATRVNRDCTFVHEMTHAIAYCLGLPDVDHSESYWISMMVVEFGCDL